MKFAKHLLMVAGAMAMAGMPGTVIAPRAVHAGAGTVVADAPAQSAQDSGCKALFDALDRLDTTPNHFFMTQISGSPTGKPENSEEILAGGVRYIKVYDRWKKSSMSRQKMEEQEKKSRQNAKEYSCSVLRNESVQGEISTVYSTHSKNEFSTADAEIWISKSKGLILREEEDLEVGGGTSHFSIRYEYGNVHAPAVSQ